MTAALTDPIFTNENSAIAHMEASRWGADLSALNCPLCGSVKAKKMATGSQAGMFLCADCRGKFSVRTGTIFERSHIPLHKWLLATHLMASSKKGISAHQLHRMLGITYKSAWFMAHRIREAMKPASGLPPLGGNGGTVEADETYIGNKKGEVKRGRGPAHKRAVVALVERGGAVRSFHVNDVRTPTLNAIIETNVSKDAHLRTDEAYHYRSIGWHFASHEAVKHSENEYVRGDIHSNTIEGVFSIFTPAVLSCPTARS